MNAWPTVILVTSLAVISPGADFAMVTRTSLMESRRAGLWVALGIGCGVLIHVAYTLLGLGMVLQRLPWLFNLLKYAGAAYLVWLGISLWRGASRANGDRPESRSSAGPGQRNARKGHAPGCSLFVLGFLTNALNPKTALFILSLFMQIVGPAVPMPTQLAYGFFVAMAHVLWFALVACFFSAPVLQPKVQAIRPWIDRSLGCVLLVLGLLLIATGTPATSNLMNASIRYEKPDKPSGRNSSICNTNDSFGAPTRAMLVIVDTYQQNSKGDKHHEKPLPLSRSEQPA